MDKFTQNECVFLVLVKVPNGNIHQLQIIQEEIKDFISSTGKFLVYEEKVEGIDFELPKLKSDIIL